MRRLSLSSLAVLPLLVLSTPALAAEPALESTGAEAVTAHLVDEALSTPPAVSAPAPQLPSAPEPSTPGEVRLEEVLQLLSQAVRSRNWGLLACALVLGAVYLVRRFGAPHVPWLRSDVGGITLSVLAAAVLQLSAALASGSPVTLSMLLGVLATAAGASGLFSWGKKLKKPRTVAQLASR